MSETWRGLVGHTIVRASPRWKYRGGELIPDRYLAGASSSAAERQGTLGPGPRDAGAHSASRRGWCPGRGKNPGGRLASGVSCLRRPALACKGVSSDSTRRPSLPICGTSATTSNSNAMGASPLPSALLRVPLTRVFQLFGLGVRLRGPASLDLGPRVRRPAAGALCFADWPPVPALRGSTSGPRRLGGRARLVRRLDDDYRAGRHPRGGGHRAAGRACPWCGPASSWSAVTGAEHGVRRRQRRRARGDPAASHALTAASIRSPRCQLDRRAGASWSRRAVWCCCSPSRARPDVVLHTTPGPVHRISARCCVLVMADWSATTAAAELSGRPPPAHTRRRPGRGWPPPESRRAAYPVALMAAPSVTDGTLASGRDCPACDQPLGTVPRQAAGCSTWPSRCSSARWPSRPRQTMIFSMARDGVLPFSGPARRGVPAHRHPGGTVAARRRCRRRAGRRPAGAHIGTRPCSSPDQLCIMLMYLAYLMVTVPMRSPAARPAGHRGARRDRPPLFSMGRWGIL